MLPFEKGRKKAAGNEARNETKQKEAGAPMEKPLAVSGWTIFSIIVGSLGFALSLSHWVYDLWKARVKLSMSDAFYWLIADPSKPNAALILNAEIINRSASPISITGLDLLDAARRKYRFERGRRPIINGRLKRAKKVTARAAYTTTRFPIHLQGFEASPIAVRVHLDTPGLLALRLPPAHNLKGLRYKQSRQLAPGDQTEWRFELLAYTSKSSFRIRSVARFQHLDDHSSRISEELKLPENQV